MSNLSSVYWIHLPEHTDITSEGYIGITTRDVECRYSEHLSLANTNSSTILSNAIRKYRDNLVIKTLLKGSEEYCLLIEKRLRPEDRIGWNIVAGGGKPPVKNTPHTTEAKNKISEASKRTCQSPAHILARKAKVGVPRTEEAKKNMREGNKGRLPWNNSTANKDIWLIADEVYKTHKENPTFGYIRLGQLFNTSKYELQNMYLSFTKQNWNPNTDQEWLCWTQDNKLNKGN